MDRPTRDQVLMEHAHVVAKRGTCSRLQVGVVVAREGRILVSGYNGAPAGMEHCDHACDCPGSMSDLTHGHAEKCNSRQPCTESVHAECNAIAFAARYGISLEGAEMHTTDSPCLPCAQLMINSGIVRVRYLREYRRREGLELLRAAGVKLSPGLT